MIFTKSFFFSKISFFTTNAFYGQFFHNACPYGFDFWRVFRDLRKGSKKYIFSIYSKNYNNLNVKKCLKLNGP